MAFFPKETRLSSGNQPNGSELVPIFEVWNKSAMAAELNYEGCNFYRQRLVLSTLSGKSVMIKNIRTFDDDPGLCGKLHFYNFN